MPKAKTCSLSCFESISSFFFSLILRFSDPFLQFSARIKAFVLSHAYLWCSDSLWCREINKIFLPLRRSLYIAKFRPAFNGLVMKSGRLPLFVGSMGLPKAGSHKGWLTVMTGLDSTRFYLNSARAWQDNWGNTRSIAVNLAKALRMAD